MLAVARLVWRLSADLALIAIATVAALVLRENISLEPAKLIDLAPYLGFSLVAAVVTGFAFGLDRALWRYAALSDFLRVIAVVALTVSATEAVVSLALASLGLVWLRPDRLLIRRRSTR